MVQKRVWLWVIVLAILAVSGCRGRSALETAEQKWQAQGINSYEIEVRDLTLWHLQNIRITVEEGVIVAQSATCEPSLLNFSSSGECVVQPFEAEQYTVPGLFELARRYNEGELREHSNITFDETYGFPTMISYTNSELLDADHSWTVISFQALP